MSEEAGGQAADTDTTDTRDYEAEARKIGWVPEDEFKGDKRPTRFKTAKEYVEDGENLTPHMRRLLDTAKAEFQQELSGIRKVSETTIAKLTKIHEGEIAELRAQKRDAVKAGNADLVEKLDDKIDKLRDEAPLTTDPKAKQAEAEKAFADANPWYGKDRKMTGFARGISQDLLREATEAGKELSFEDNIREVLKAVREEFPEYFQSKTPAANGHAAVDGGSENGPAPSKSDPLAKYSAEVRTQAAEDMKKFPKVYPTKQSWVDAFTGKN